MEIYVGKNEKIPKTLLQFFIYILSPYKRLVASLLFVGFYYGLHISLSAYLLKSIINHISSFEGDRNLIFGEVKYLVLFYIFLFVLIAINMRFRDWVALRLFPCVRQRIVEKMFMYLTHHSHNFFQDNFSGSLANKIDNMATGVVTIFTKMDAFFSQFFVLLGSIIVMFLVQPLFAGILIVWVGMFLVSTFYFSKNVRILSYALSTSNTKLAGKVVDCIGNMATLRLFSRNDYEEERMKKYLKEALGKDRKMQSYVLRMHIVWDISIIFLMSSMIVSLIYMYSKDVIKIGDFTLVVMLSVSLFQGMWWLASEFVKFAEELGKCSQALSVIKASHEIVDVDSASTLFVKKGKISFKNVTFHYRRGNNIFYKENVVIKSCQKVGLVGFSGSGKSTFVNLILRFFDVNSGEIYIDDYNIAQVKQKSLRENISMIPQDTMLFHRSLMENIRYGNLKATDEDVIEASKKAYCHEFINKLPEGYKALVGERGIKLSGGQRQRIAIARSFLKNAPILILDEATSSLDTITERFIQKGIYELMKNRTTIVIAHRLSTLSEMDRILVFDEGHIVEDGTHNSLLKEEGHYARMWKMQAGGFLPETK